MRLARYDDPGVEPIDATWVQVRPGARRCSALTTGGWRCGSAAIIVDLCLQHFKMEDPEAHSKIEKRWRLREWSLPWREELRTAHRPTPVERMALALFFHETDLFR